MRGLLIPAALALLAALLLSACLYSEDDDDLGDDGESYLRDLNLVEARSTDALNELFEDMPSAPAGTPQFFTDIGSLATRGIAIVDGQIADMQALTPPSRAEGQHEAIVDYGRQIRSQLEEMRDGAKAGSMTRIVQVINWFGENENSGAELYDDLLSALE